MERDAKAVDHTSMLPDCLNPRVNGDGVFLHTLSDEAWRKLFTAAALMGCVEIRESNEYVAQRAVKHADAALAELKRTEPAGPALPLGAFPERRGGLEATDGETQCQ